MIITVLNMGGKNPCYLRIIAIFTYLYILYELLKFKNILRL